MSVVRDMPGRTQVLSLIVPVGSMNVAFFVGVANGTSGGGNGKRAMTEEGDR